MHMGVIGSERYLSVLLRTRPISLFNLLIINGLSHNKESALKGKPERG